MHNSEGKGLNYETMGACIKKGKITKEQGIRMKGEGIVAKIGVT